MSDHIWDFVGHEQILVGQWPMTNSYLQPWSSDREKNPGLTLVCIDPSKTITAPYTCS